MVRGPDHLAKSTLTDFRPKADILNLWINSDLTSATELPGLQNAFCPGNIICRDLLSSGFSGSPDLDRIEGAQG